MATVSTNNPEREERLNAALAACLEAVENGQVVDRQQLLARYPEFASELAEFFAGRDKVDGMAAPLRQALQDQPPACPAAAVAAPPNPLGDFRILREVGRGGMGIVYEAEQMSLRRRVALKVLPFAGALDPRHLQRFKNESQAAAQLHHTNIVPVHYVGCERGVHFYAMQFIEGQSLASVIAELRRQSEPRPSGSGKDNAAPTAPYTPLPDGRGSDNTPPMAVLSTQRSTKDATYFRTVAELGIQAAEGLDHAHQQGIVHRDIKPANLMVSGEPGTSAPGLRLWITDFGLAQVQSDTRLTLTGDLVGTLRYMSPEQALAKRVIVDNRTDIYSLGVTLYELLTLEPAYRGNDRQELLRQIAFEEPKTPRRINKSIPPELEIIVLKAMEKNPAERYATAQELADDLRRFVDDKPIRAKRPSAVQRVRKWSRRHQGFVWAAVGMLILATAGFAVATAVVVHERDDAIRQQKLAEQESDRARRAHYAASMHLTYSAWQAGDIDEARELLDTFLPSAGQPDLRGWEWHYLHALCRRECLTLSSPVSEKDHWESSFSLPVVGRLFYTAVWSPDGRRLATACSPRYRGYESIAGSDARGLIEIWDAATGQKVRSWTGHEQGRVKCLAWSPDGKKLASASGDGTIGVWKAETGHKELLIGVASLNPRREDEVSSVTWSPDGQRLASAGQDGTVKIWEWPTGKELLSLRGHQNGVFSVAWSPDGKRLGSAGEDGTARIWDGETGRQLQILAAPAIRNPLNCGASMVSWSPNGKHFAAASRDSVRVWDTATWQVLHILSGHKGAVFSVAWSPEGLRLASAGVDCTARIWDVITGEELLRLRGHSSLVWSVAWDSEGQHLATTSADGTAKVWHAVHDQEALTLGPVQGSSRQLGWSGDSKQLMSTTYLGGTKIWDANSGLEVAALGETQTAWAAWSPDGKRLASKLRRGPVRVREVSTGRQVCELPLPPEFAGIWPVPAAWSPDGTRLACPALEVAPDPNDPKAFRPIWSGVKIWDTATWREILLLTVQIPNGWASTDRVAWSPDSGRIAATSADGTIWMFDAANGEVVFTVPGAFRAGGSSLAWSPDGKVIAVGDNSGTIRLLNSGTGEEIHAVRGHTQAVHALAWSPDSQRLASAASDVQGEVKLWDTASWHVVLVWRQQPVAAPAHLAWSPDGKRLASAGSGSSGLVKVWDAAPRNLAWGNLGARNNDSAWFLATSADLRWRDPVQAVRLARKAVEGAPQERTFWNTLGAAHYRAGNWDDAVQALNRSMQLGQGGDSFDWFFLAMAHRQLGYKEQARKWYDQAVHWMEKNNPQDEELRRFRAEAAELLGVKDQPTPKETKESHPKAQSKPPHSPSPPRGRAEG